MFVPELRRDELDDDELVEREELLLRDDELDDDELEREELDEREELREEL